MGEMKNKGEWSELYTFAWILLYGAIPLVDQNLVAIPGAELRVKRVLRDDGLERVSFEPLTGTSVDFPSRGWLKAILPEFLNEIRGGSGPAFTSVSGSALLDAFGLSKVKAASNEKVDLKLQIASNDGIEPEAVGFSIKSRVGNASTLLNASQQTAVRFAVLGLDAAAVDLEAINAHYGKKQQISARLENLQLLGGSLAKGEWASTTFRHNLELVDSAMPEVLADFMIFSYKSKETRWKALIPAFAASRSISQHVLENMFKRLLLDAALGMVPGTRWDGQWQAYGGYLVVQDDGRVIAYTMRNFDHYKEYLLNEVRFETPSGSRYNSGVFHAIGNQIALDLTLQIRFAG